MGTFEKTMKYVTVGTLLGGIICGIFYNILQIDLLFTLTITFGVTCYHFAMRLLVGGIIVRIFHNRMNYNNKWFSQRSFEPALYKKLKVKQWKDKMPTYSPSTFSIKEHSWEEIAQASCQAEIVHEVIVVLCFLPILLVLVLDSVWVFLITSTLSALADTPFIIMQRYNRPRIVKMIQKPNTK